MTINKKFLGKHLHRVNELLKALPTLENPDYKALEDGLKPGKVLECVFYPGTEKVSFQLRDVETPSDGAAKGGQLCVELVSRETGEPVFQIYGIDPNARKLSKLKNKVSGFK